MSDYFSAQYVSDDHIVLVFNVEDELIVLVTIFLSSQIALF